MNKIFAVFIILYFSSICYCQNAEDSVKTAINKIFTAMKTGNKQMLIESFADSAILQTVAKDKAGEPMVKTEDIKDFATQITNLPKGAADERITFDVVKVDGDLAIAWTPYQFYFNDAFSHCGVNSFQLVRLGGVWKIQYIIDTRRKDSCK